MRYYVNSLEFREWIGAENTNKPYLGLFMLFKTMKEMVWGELQSELDINQRRGTKERRLRRWRNRKVGMRCDKAKKRECFKKVEWTTWLEYFQKYM